MKLVFNPTGTHVKQNIRTGDKFLKVRIDFFPEETEKTYQLHHVYVPVFPEGGYLGEVDKEGKPVDWDAYNLWVAGLPHIWQLNPAICCFFTVPENIQTSDFILELNTRFKPDDIATLDNYLILPDSVHYVSPFNKNRLKLTSEKVTTSDIEDLKATINQRFASIKELKPSSGGTLDIQPQSLDVGAAATNRATNTDFLERTIIAKENPVNGDGTIESAELWLYIDCADTDVGMVAMSGNNATIRDYENIGSIASGSKQTASGLTTTCTSGDYIGISSPETGQGHIERDSSGTGYWITASDVQLASLSSTACNSYSSRTISLYGTGTESGGGVTIPVMMHHYTKNIKAG